MPFHKVKKDNFRASGSSKTALQVGVHDPSSETSRRLRCLIEGEPPIFTVNVLGSELITGLKQDIHEQGIRKYNRGLYHAVFRVSSDFKTVSILDNELQPLIVEPLDSKGELVLLAS